MRSEGRGAGGSGRRSRRRHGRSDTRAESRVEATAEIAADRPSGSTPALAPPASPAPAATGRPRRRDRRGRGLRGDLAPAGVPLHRTHGQAFDELVMDAVDELEEHWGAELAGVEFAVEDVPPQAAAGEFEPDVVTDRGVALARLFRSGLPEIDAPVIVLYRRPIEARAVETEDRSDLIFMIVVDLAAEYLGRDLDDI